MRTDLELMTKGGRLRIQGYSSTVGGGNTIMRINVAQLLKESTGAARQHHLSEDIREIDDELCIQAPLTGSLQLIRTTNGILVTGTLRTVLELECCRCLAAFSAPVELEIEEEFRPSVDIETGAELPVTEPEEEGTIIDEHHILDLTEIVRQSIFLVLPMHPLCKEDCAGLCSQCGQNLNEGECDCVTEAIDPRLEALKELL